MVDSGALLQGRAPLGRYELKYLVPEERVPALRRAIEPYCRPDSHTGSCGASGYPITSLYLDSPGLYCYRAKKDRHLDRFKLRVRSYGEDPGAAATFFIEVKRKVGDRVIKYRASAPREQVDSLLCSSGCARWSTQTGGAAGRFVYLAGAIGAEPSVVVRYWREAYVGLLEQYSRVTFDRRLRAQLPHPDRVWEGLSHRRWQGLDHPLAMRLPRSCVVLELKFGSAAPSWMSALVRRFELVRVGFSKYCVGLELLRGPEPSLREATGTTAVRVFDG